eukprot:10155490-Lingulodinium_polyedra.AAC.1
MQNPDSDGPSGLQVDIELRVVTFNVQSLRPPKRPGERPGDMAQVYAEQFRRGGFHIVGLQESRRKAQGAAAGSY